ncbi:response regulator transcription factor [Parapusillimonas sp. SGNA-6]|nr:response regulator transcription factor [Parapusillimonas sp. SGNA-6]
MKRVVIIDPNPLLRRALVHLLSDISPDLSFEESDYAPLFARKSLTHTPDLVILAFSRLEDLHDLATSVHHVYGPKAIMLLPDTDAIYPSIEGLPPTVAGYVAKDSPCEVIRASTRLVLAGGTCFPLALSVNGAESMQPAQGDLFADIGPVPLPPPKAAVPGDSSGMSPIRVTEGTQSHTRTVQAECEMLGITPRQYEVLVLLARGHSVKSISRHMAISIATVKSHAETLYKRLGVNNRNAAVYEAVSRGANLDRTFTLDEAYTESQDVARRSRT